MRERLIQYVDLLFAGAADCEDIKQEILQNTLDRFDDLTAEGKSPEAAYRLAIIGIGDITEILGTAKPAPAPKAPPRTYADNAVRKAQKIEEDDDTPHKKRMRAIAIGLYILCPIPLLLLGSIPGLETFGICSLLLIVAAATVLMVLNAKKDEEEDKAPKSELQKSIDSAIWAVGIAIYFVLSFLTNAWHITWVIFLITGAVQGLIKAILDLKEVMKHEN